MVAGLGTITPASGYVGPLEAIVIGLTAGIVCFYATQLIKRRFKIDDSLGVFPVHGVGGILGTLLVGVFSFPGLGLFSGHGFGEGNESIAEQFSVQVAAVLVTIIFTGVMTYLIVKITGWITGGIRVTKDEETLGLDLVLHEESGYKI